MAGRREGTSLGSTEMTTEVGSSDSLESRTLLMYLAPHIVTSFEL